MHYSRWRQSGDVGEAGPRYSKSTASLGERLLKFGWAVTESGCWEWSGSRHPTGYGFVGIGRQKVDYAHRISWVLANGEIPDGMFVCHSCDNPPCLNPAHLFLGTVEDNNRDMFVKRRHAYGERNGHAMLSDSDVEKIRADLNAGVSPAVLAERWSVGASYIVGIRAGRNRRLA